MVNQPVEPKDAAIGVFLAAVAEAARDLDKPSQFLESVRNSLDRHKRNLDVGDSPKELVAQTYENATEMYRMLHTYVLRLDYSSE